MQAHGRAAGEGAARGPLSSQARLWRSTCPRPSRRRPSRRQSRRQSRLQSRRRATQRRRLQGCPRAAGRVSNMSKSKTGCGQPPVKQPPRQRSEATGAASAVAAAPRTQQLVAASLAAGALAGSTHNTGPRRSMSRHRPAPRSTCRCGSSAGWWVGWGRWGPGRDAGQVGQIGSGAETRERAGGTPGVRRVHLHAPAAVLRASAVQDRDHSTTSNPLPAQRKPSQSKAASGCGTAAAPSHPGRAEGHGGRGALRSHSPGPGRSRCRRSMCWTPGTARCPRTCACPAARTGRWCRSCLPRNTCGRRRGGAQAGA